MHKLYKVPSQVTSRNGDSSSDLQLSPNRGVQKPGLLADVGAEVEPLTTDAVEVSGCKDSSMDKANLMNRVGNPTASATPSF